MKKYTKPQIKTLIIDSTELLSGSMEAKKFNNFEETEQVEESENIWDEKYSPWEK